MSVDVAQRLGYAVANINAASHRPLMTTVTYSIAGIELHHLVKTKTPKLVVTEAPATTESQRSKLFRLIESFVDGVEREDYVPSPGLQCAACEFFNECRAWSHNPAVERRLAA